MKINSLELALFLILTTSFSSVSNTFLNSEDEQTKVILESYTKTLPTRSSFLSFSDDLNNEGEIDESDDTTDNLIGTSLQDEDMKDDFDDYGDEDLNQDELDIGDDLNVEGDEDSNNDGEDDAEDDLDLDSEFESEGVDEMTDGEDDEEDETTDEFDEEDDEEKLIEKFNKN